jgi:hypothetical protein
MFRTEIAVLVLAAFVMAGLFVAPEMANATHCDPIFNTDIGPNMDPPNGGAQAVADDCTGDPGCNDYFDMILAAGDTVSLSFCGLATWDTGLSVWSGAGFGTLEACNDDFCGLQSQLAFVAPAAGTYRMRVGGFGGSNGSYTLQYSATAGSVIIGANTPPVASCTESVNPSGRNTPPAGSTTLPGSKGGKNEDGFYELVGEDNEDGTAPVFVTNASGSATFGPFSSGSVVKITEAPGRTPTAKSMGGPSSAVAAHITLDSDAFVFAVDSGGEESPVVSCLVPPPPK